MFLRYSSVSGSHTGAKLLFVSSLNKFNPSIAGFDLYSDIGSIGGFTAGGGHGMSLPGDDGWK
jgi:hypothetical protein